MRCSAGRGGVKPARSSGKRLSNPQTMFRLRQSDPISTSALDSIVSESPSQQSGLLFPLSTTESKLPHCDILGHIEIRSLWQYPQPVVAKLDNHHLGQPAVELVDGSYHAAEKPLHLWKRSCVLRSVLSQASRKRVWRKHERNRQFDEKLRLPAGNLTHPFLTICLRLNGVDMSEG